VGGIGPDLGARSPQGPRYSLPVTAAQAPDGFTARAASVDDAEAIADLVNEANIAEVGVPWTTPDDIRTDLMAPGHESNDDVLLVADDGSLAGYLTTWRDEPLTMIFLIAFVRPSDWGSGLSAWLLRLGEARARGRVERIRPRTPIRVQVARWAGNASAAALFETLGYAYVRTFHEMRIELADQAERASVPDGIRIRTFDPERDREPVHGALAEAFDDHWGSNFDPYDAWVHDNIDTRAGFDPDLWFVAVDGDEVVGVVCCRPSAAAAPDAVEVGELGVRRAWRHRGIGRALLLRAFAEAREKGFAAVELGVDSESLTGATRLYESVGMHPVRSFERWEKLLEPGAA